MQGDPLVLMFFFAPTQPTPYFIFGASKIGPSAVVLLCERRANVPIHHLALHIFRGINPGGVLPRYYTAPKWEPDS